MARLALGLGSNLGDRLANIRGAVERIETELGRVVLKSAVYETPPWGLENQPWFLNACVAVETELKPAPILKRIRTIEAALKRRRTKRWGPRIIDVDMLLYEDFTLDTPNLKIPHPMMHERAFVLLPLAEIAPDWRHPLLGRSVSELLLEADGAGIERITGI